MARTIKAQVGDALLGRERFERLRRYYYGRKQAAANKKAIQKHFMRGNAIYASELMWLTGRSMEWMLETADEYAQSKTWSRLSGLRSTSKYTDGIIQTLDVAEGFVAWALVKHVRPHTIVELGTQFGLTARLWKDALRKYVPDHMLFLCDIVDRRQYIDDSEAIFMLGDGLQSLEQIMTRQKVDILYNDAHPYDLIRGSLRLGMEHGTPCFAFHDVGGRELRGFPFLIESAALSEEEKYANSLEFIKFGHWERHCMAEVFDQRILVEEAVENEQWRMQIFDSLFGFGAVLAKDFIADTRSGLEPDK